MEDIVEKVISLLEDDPGYLPGGPADEWPLEWWPGDTVFGAMGIPERYWQAHPGQFVRMCDVVARASADGLLSEDVMELHGSLYLRPPTSA